MRLHRTWSLLSLILTLSFTASCTTSDGGPTAASFSYRPETPEVLTLLSCKPQRYVSTSKVVGSKGDRIRFGTHVLSIPAGALSGNVTITAEQVSGSVNSVRFSPEGLTFAVPAELTLSYDNCTSIDQPKSIVYTDEQLDILEHLRSNDKTQSKTVVSPIDHFSRYAVAY